jgi:D-beta-D-heptose 7-phosphate kinase/D-beta-D-heptose 1-phosphate adenosyltransferase
MRNKKLVGFANGCFDIIHFGHIELLKKAKSKCDFLIVGLNTDKSVSKIKGKNRPILNLKNRLTIMKSIRYVDKVIVFNEKDPLKIIKNIKPDIIFKGSDYKKKNIIGYEFQKSRKKSVQVVKLKGNISTSKIINKLTK